MNLDDDDVLDLAQKARAKAEGIDLIEGWAKAAHALFKGGTVTQEHPSGAERISNIARVALRHDSPKNG